MRYISFVALTVIVAGCTTSPVKMRNLTTGQLAQCGPYYIDGLGSNAQADREARCIGDFQRQGFERLAD